jgi:hypothetical protein
MITLTEK